VKVRRALLMVPLILLLALSIPAVVAADAEAPTEPTVVVETYPQWRAGDLALFILDFPQDGATYQRSTIRFRVAVWGATPENPVVILLDGEEAARITAEGMYTYEWGLMGSHHLLIRCSTKIFQQAAFNVKAPPPPPPVIQLSEFEKRLAEQRVTMLLLSVAATAAGVPTGIWLKKKTKVTSAWAVTPLGVFIILGLRYLPELYMLIPYGVSAALTYQLAREYADYLAVSVIEEGGIETDVLPLDDEGRAILAVGPKHWRDGFMHVKPIELIDNRMPINFRFKGTLLRCIVVEGEKNIEKTEDRITIRCAPALARTIAEARVIERLQDELADTRFKVIYMERALRGVISQAIEEMERIAEDQLLDETSTLGEARSRVREAAEAMKHSLEAAQQTPVEEPVEVDVDA